MRRIRNLTISGIEGSVKILQPLLVPIEFLLERFFGDRGASRYPPIFLIGPPRSGSTLIFRLLTNCYHLSFISNFSVNFPRTPIVASTIENILRPNSRSNSYDFEFGYIPGRNAPHEAGRLWERWFPYMGSHYVRPNSISKNDIKQIRHIVGGISHLLRRPMIMKTVFNSMRISPLMEAFPNARFLVCKRNKIETALSIYRARVAKHLSASEWWSAVPRAAEKRCYRTNWQLAVAQVFYTYQQIDEDRKKYGDCHFFNVEYEKLCEDPKSTLLNIERFLNSGTKCVQSIALPPRSFEISIDHRAGSGFRKKITDAFTSLENE